MSQNNTFFDDPGFVRNGEPLVTLAMPTFNDEAYLEVTLESLLKQSFQRFRLIISDNLSSDRTADIIKRYSEHDGRIEVIFNTRNIGAGLNWKQLLDIADTKYFAWVGPHDLYHPLWLECLVAALEQNNRAILAYPFTQGIDAHGDELYRQIKLDQTSGIKSPTLRLLAATTRMRGMGNKIYGLFKLRMLKKIRFYYCPTWDRMYLISLAAVGEFMQVPYVLWSRRHHDVEGKFSEPKKIKAKMESLLARQYRSIYEGGIVPASHRALTLYQAYCIYRNIKKRCSIFDQIRVTGYFIWSNRHRLPIEVKLLYNTHQKKGGA